VSHDTGKLWASSQKRWRQRKGYFVGGMPPCQSFAALNGALSNLVLDHLEELPPSLKWQSTLNHALDEKIR
jgi:hypothetical protein